MKSPGSVYIKEESDMFVSDITLVSDSQEHNMHKRKKPKRQIYGSEDTTSDSEASSSQSLLKVRKKKYSEMVGELHFRNDSSTVKKKKKLSIDFLTQEIFKQLSENSTDSSSKKSNKELNMNGVCGSVMSPVQKIKQEINRDSTMNGLLDVSLTNPPTKKDKTKRVTGLDSSNITQQNCNTIEFGNQDIFKQPSSEEFVYSTPKKSKNDKLTKRNGSDVKDSRMSPINKIEPEITLNSTRTTDGLHDASIEHSKKKRKKKDKTHKSNLEGADENSSFSSVPYTSASSEMFQLPYSHFGNSTPKKSKKKKHKERNGSDVQDSRRSLINEIKSENTTDGLHDVSIEHSSTKKRKKVKTDSSNLQHADENSSFSYSPSSHINKTSPQLHHSFDISIDSMHSTELEESEINSPYHKHKKKKKHEHMENDGILGNDTKESDDFYCQFCQSSFNNISGNDNRSLDNRDILSSRIGYQTRDSSENTNKIKKKKRQKSVGEARENGKKESVLNLLEKYLATNNLDLSLSDSNDDTTNNDLSAKSKRNDDVVKSTMLNGESNKAFDSSTSDILSDVCDNNVDNQDKLDDNLPSLDDTEMKRKSRKKKNLSRSMMSNSGSNKAFDSSTSDILSDACDKNVDSQDKLDDNLPSIDTEKRRKSRKKKNLSRSMMSQSDSNKAFDSSTSDILSDVCDKNVEGQDKLDDNLPSLDDTEKRRKSRKKKNLSRRIMLNNGSDKAFDSSTSDILSDACDKNVDGQDKLDDNLPSLDDTEKRRKSRNNNFSRSIMSNSGSDKVFVSSTYDISSEVCNNNVDSQDKLDDNCMSDQKEENPKLDKSDDTSKILNGLGNKIDRDLIYSSDSDEGVEEDDLKFALKRLEIEVDFPVPKLHKICNRASKPTPKQRLEVAKHEILVKTGKFVKSEDTRIKENWQKFIQMYNFPDEPTVFFSLDKKYISVKEKQNFLCFLAQGLNERTPFSVYQRFKLLMCQIKRGRFTSEEDEYIKQEVKEYRGVRNYIANIALHLNRSFYSVEKRIDRLEHGHTRKIRWKGRNMAAFIKHLLIATGIEPNNIEKLKDRHISSAEWMRLSDQLDEVPPRILRRAWLEKFHTMLFIPEDCCDMRRVKLKLVNLLFENNEDDWRAVNWSNYASHFEGLTPTRIYSLIKTLVATKVPHKDGNNLKKCIKILRKCTVDDLFPHFIYKVKYVDGKIIKLPEKGNGKKKYDKYLE